MKQIFTFLASLFMALAISGQVTLTNDSLLAYYDFENNSNNQFADRFHLSPTFSNGGAAPTFAAGKQGYSVQFNRNNALINIDELAQHLATSENKSLSISFWLNYSGANGTNSLATFVEFFESLYMRGSNFSFGMAAPGTLWTSAVNAGTISGGWNHYVTIYDAENKMLSVYANGQLRRQVAVPGDEMMQITSMIVLGAGTNNSVLNYTHKGFAGGIDEMYIYNRVLLEAEVHDLYYMRVVAAEVVSSDKLIAHYDFEADATNKAGEHFHLTAALPASNMTGPNFIADGKSGNAVSFNGNSAFWNETDFGTLSESADKNLTVSTWVRHRNNNTTLYFTVFELFESMFLRNNISLGISRANGIFNSTAGGVTIPPHQWVHLTAVYDQEKAETRLYINGDLRGTLTGITDFHAYNSVFIVGAGTNNGTPNFSGKGFIGDVDEMYIFNRILTPAEIYGMVNLSPVATPRYPVVFDASIGGTLTATVDGEALASGDLVEVGKTITFTATPNEGFTIFGWLNNGVSISFRGGNPSTINVKHNEPGTNRVVTFIVAETSVRSASFETLSLYPNPTRDRVRIEAENTIEKVEVYSLSGALLHAVDGNGASSMDLQLEQLSEGLYLVKTYTRNGLFTAKLKKIL